MAINRIRLGFAVDVINGHNSYWDIPIEEISGLKFDPSTIALHFSANIGHIATSHRGAISEAIEASGWRIGAQLPYDRQVMIEVQGDDFSRSSILIAARGLAKLTRDEDPQELFEFIDHLTQPAPFEGIANNSSL